MQIALFNKKFYNLFMENKEFLFNLLKRIEVLEEKIKKLEEKECRDDKKTVKPERGTYTKLVIDYINDQILRAKKEGKEYIELTSGDVQKAVGLKNRLPLVCKAMRKCMNKDCVIMHKTPSMQSSTLTIRWDLKEDDND